MYLSQSAQNFFTKTPRADSLEKTLMLGKTEGRRRRGWQKMRGLDDITDSMDMSLSKCWEIVRDREAWGAAVCGVTKSRIHSNWTTTMLLLSFPGGPVVKTLCFHCKGDGSDSASACLSFHTDPPRNKLLPWYEKHLFIYHFPNMKSNQ